MVMTSIRVTEGVPNGQRVADWLSGEQVYKYTPFWDNEDTLFAPPHITQRIGHRCTACGEDLNMCVGQGWNGLWPADTCGCDAMWMLSNPARPLESFTLCNSCHAVMIAGPAEYDALNDRSPAYLECSFCGTARPGTQIRICADLVSCDTCWYGTLTASQQMADRGQPVEQAIIPLL